MRMQILSRPWGGTSGLGFMMGGHCAPRGHKTSLTRWFITARGTEYWCQGLCTYCLPWCFLCGENSAEVDHLLSLPLASQSSQGRRSKCSDERNGRKMGLHTPALPHGFLLCPQWRGTAVAGSNLGWVSEPAFLGGWTSWALEFQTILPDVALSVSKVVFWSPAAHSCISQLVLNSSGERGRCYVSTFSDMNN